MGYYVSRTARELAADVIAIRESGNPYPTAAQIAAARYGKCPGRVLINTVRRKLSAIKGALEEEGYSVILLTKVFYADFRKSFPDDEPSCRRCFAGGSGPRRAEGIGFVTENDPIYEAYLKLTGVSWKAQANKHLTRISRELEHDRISVTMGSEIIWEGAGEIYAKLIEAHSEAMLNLEPTMELAGLLSQQVDRLLPDETRDKILKLVKAFDQPRLDAGGYPSQVKIVGDKVLLANVVDDGPAELTTWALSNTMAVINRCDRVAQEQRLSFERACYVVLHEEMPPSIYDIRPNEEDCDDREGT